MTTTGLLENPESRPCCDIFRETGLHLITCSFYQEKLKEQVNDARRRGNERVIHPTKPFEPMSPPPIREEKIDHPAHYGGDTVYEAIKVIEAWGLNFNLGNTVKYLSRIGKKGATLENLKKSRWYLDREIANLEKI